MQPFHAWQQACRRGAYHIRLVCDIAGVDADSGFGNPFIMLDDMLHRTDEGVAAEPPAQAFQFDDATRYGFCCPVEAERTVITCKPGFQCHAVCPYFQHFAVRRGIGLEQHIIGCGYVLRFQVSLLVQLGNGSTFLDGLLFRRVPRHGIIPRKLVACR